MNIYLVGMPGSGKSLLGRLLAVELGRPFLDTDEEITRRLGLSPEEIIEQSGEEKLRTLEHQLLLELCRRDDLVVSTGGGLPIFHDNMRIMNDQGITLYLSSNPGMLWERLRSDRRRPLSLTYEATRALLERRESLYEKAKITLSIGEDQKENLEAAMGLLRTRYPDETLSG